jgi:hypothetical protein
LRHFEKIVDLFVDIDRARLIAFPLRLGNTSFHPSTVIPNVVS